MNKPSLPKLGRRGKISLGVVLVIMLLVVSSLLVLSQPAPKEPGVEPSERNSILYHALANESITDAVVNITDERAFVRYNVPGNMSKNESIYYTLGAAARLASGSDRIVLEVYTDFEPDEKVVVSMDAANKFLTNEISTQEFRNEIQRSKLQTDP